LSLSFSLSMSDWSMPRSDEEDILAS
jgi:hypothetical protein